MEQRLGPTSRPGVLGLGFYLIYSAVSGLGTETLLDKAVEHRGQYMRYINAEQTWRGRRGNRQPKIQMDSK